MSKQFNTRIQHKIDTYENWNKAENFIPLKGEIIIYTTNEKGEAETKIKIGDGTTKVNNLEFAVSDSASGEVSTNAIQSDWAQTDTTKLDYIKNKPEIGINIEENSSKLATSGAVFEAIKKIAEAGGIAYEAGKLTKIENNKISSTLGDKLSETFEIPVWEDFGVLDLVFQPGMFGPNIDVYVPKEPALNPNDYMLSHLKSGTAPIHDLSVIEMYDPNEGKTYLLDATMTTAFDQDGMQLIVGYNLNIDLSTGQLSAIDDTKPITAICYIYITEDKTSYAYLPITLMDYSGWSYKVRKVTPIVSLENISVSYDDTPFEGFYASKSYSVNLSAIENNKDSLFFSIKTSDGLNIEKQINLIDFPGSLLGNPDVIYPAFFINATNSSMAEFISSGLIKEDSQYVSGAMGFASNGVMIILDSDVVIESISIYSKDKSESYVHLPDTAIATDDYLEYIDGKLQSTFGKTRIRTIDVPYFNKIINIDTFDDNLYTYTENSSNEIILLPYWLENQPITIEINHNNETYIYQEKLVFLANYAGSEIPVNVICVNIVETAEEIISNSISTITPKDSNKPAFVFIHIFIPGYGSSFRIASLNGLKDVHINAIVHETKETIVSIPDRAIRGENYIEYKNGIIKTTLGEKKFIPVTRTLVNSTFSETLTPQNGLYMWGYPIEDDFTLQDLKFHLYDSNEKIVFYENMQLTYNPELDEILSSLIGVSFSNGVYGVLNSSSTPLEILSTGQIPLINESYRYGFACGITYINGQANFIITSTEDLAEAEWGLIVTDIIEEIYTEKLPSSLIQMNIGKGLIDNNGILENSYGRIINYTKSPRLTYFYSSFLNEYVNEDGELYYVKELESYDIKKLYNSSAKAFAIDFHIDDDTYSIIAPVEQELGIKACEFNFIHNNNLYNLTFMLTSSIGCIISNYKYSTTFSFYELTNLEYEKIPVEALPEDIGGGKVSSVNGQIGDVEINSVEHATTAETLNGYKIRFSSEPPTPGEVDEFTLTFVI